MLKFQPQQKKVLHITAHLGGGVGRVVLNYLFKTNQNSNFKHKILSFGYTEEHMLKGANEAGVELLDNLWDKHKIILEEIERSDVVLLHWWNHPLLYDFLVREKLPRNRMVMWSHVSGFNSPQVFTDKIIDYSDIFAFTTPLSFKTKDIANLKNELKEKLRVVWSTGGVEHTRSLMPKKHTGFNVGYIGTVDYAKMHRNFINICKKIKIPDVKFIVCGGPNEKEMKREAVNAGVGHKFKFTGYVANISKHLEVFDLFGYPLCKNHYGTCDQVLTESMAAGVVPVVLNNRMEKYMIKDGVNGIVAKDEDEYVRAVEHLYKNKLLRESLAKSAKDHSIATFSIDKMSRDWENIFEEAMDLPKTKKAWDLKIKTITPKDVFLESLGGYGRCFLEHCEASSQESEKKALAKIMKLRESEIWRSKTKGTVHNYCSYFPQDEHLSYWSKLIQN